MADWAAGGGALLILEEEQAERRGGRARGGSTTNTKKQQFLLGVKLQSKRSARFLEASIKVKEIKIKAPPR